MEISTISITLWGDGLVKGNWAAWYDDVGKIFQSLDYKRTHIGIQSDVYANRKIVSVLRKERQILELLNEDGEVSSLSCYSLPKEYKVAAFDYNVLVVRQSKYISLIFNKSDLKKIVIDEIISVFTKYIEFVNGEVYQMDRTEVPLIYAAKANPISEFKTLKILRKF